MERRARQWSIGVALAAALLVAGCGTRPYEGEATGEGAPQTPPGRTEAAPLTVCAPKAIAHAPSTRPTLPEGWGTVCQLVQTRDDHDADGTPEQLIDYVHEAGGVRATSRARGARSSHSHAFRLDDAGRVLEVSQRDDSTGHGHAYAWEYDEAGQLIRELHTYRYAYGGEGEREVVQTWAAGKLASRTQRERGRVTERLTWRHDDAGRLVEATALDPQSGAVRERALWSYDAVGRPARWLREGDGLRAEVAFRYGESGVVQGRVLQLAREPRGPYSYAQWSHAFDQYSTPRHGEQPAQDADCVPLPTAIVHGYQGDAGAYALGLRDPETEPELQRMYMTLTPYYAYVPPTAFAHTGTIGDYDELLPVHSDTTVTVITDYDARGRMTRESVQGTTLHAVRERSYEGERLTLDRLDTNAQSDRGRPLGVRVLAFEYDTAGRLTSRTLADDEGELVRHAWRYDGLGRLVAHALESSERGQQVLGRHERGSLRRTYDAAGRPNLDEVFRAAANGEPELRFSRARTFDAAGRLTLETTDQHGSRQETRTTYDARGAITRVLTRSRNATTTEWQSEWEERTTRNAHGLPVLREWNSRSNRSTSRRTQTSTYRCGE